MRIFFDTEFIENGKMIDLISIGLVSENGQEFYAELSDCDLSKANPWVKTNVIPHLKGDKKPRWWVAEQIKDFAGNSPEFWAYYADYDWVALCQLFGTMMDLPETWPMYCRDLKQLHDDQGSPELPKQSTTEHHALADARWNAQIYGVLA